MTAQEQAAAIAMGYAEGDDIAKLQAEICRFAAEQVEEIKLAAAGPFPMSMVREWLQEKQSELLEGLE